MSFIPEYSKVRLLVDMQAKDPYTSEMVFVPAGQVGVVIAAFDGACDVDFTLPLPGEVIPDNACLTLEHSQIVRLD